MDRASYTVTAIVVGHNHAHCLGRCIDSLTEQQGLTELEILYIDNASSDSSPAMTGNHPQIQAIRNAQNIGFARAVNQGLAIARGRYTALVNPDTAIGPQTLRMLVDLLETRPELGLVGPLLLSEDGRQQQSLAHYPTLTGMLKKWAGLPPGPRGGWLIGAFVVAETDRLRRMGGLDERYFVYGEDMDLSHRIQQDGLRVEVEPGVHITHTGNPRWSMDRLARIYGGYLRFLDRHHHHQRLPAGLLLSLWWLVRGCTAGTPPLLLVDGLQRIWSRRPDRPPEGGRR